MFQTLCQSVSRNVLSCARNYMPRENVYNRFKEMLPSVSRNSAYTCTVINRNMATLHQMHRARERGERKPMKKKTNVALEGNAFKRGVVLKTLIKKPKKPNSANRKCVRVRLTNGREVTAYVPGEGHNLQEHSIVLIQGGKLQDTPGVKLTCVRGKYDLPHVKKEKK